MRTPLALGLAALGLLALSPVARAQNVAPGVPSGPRVLHDLIDDVKLEDGSTARWHFVTIYDPATGVTETTVTDEAGRVVHRENGPGGLNVPAPEELVMAEAIIRADPELAAILAVAPNPVVSGGFTLMREAGHPCGPGSRCLQYDIMNVNEAERQVERLRYVVVDLREGRVLYHDFDVVNEGNMANPLTDRSTTY